MVEASNGYSTLCVPLLPDTEPVSGSAVVSVGLPNPAGAKFDLIQKTPADGNGAWYEWYAW